MSAYRKHTAEVRAHATARSALEDGWRHPTDHARLPLRVRAVLAALDRLEVSADEGSTR